MMLVLPAPLRPTETDALARIDLEVDLIKERPVGVAERDAAELEKGHDAERMKDES